MAAGNTFKQLQDDTLDICQDLQKKPDFTLVRVKRMINRGYRNFCKDTNCIEDVLNFTTVANQQYYSSTDTANFAYAYRVIGAKYITTATEFGKPLVRYPGGYSKLPKNMAYGTPVYYYDLGMGSVNQRKIGTYPIIDVVETLEVKVNRYPTVDLSAIGDIPVIDDEYHDALVFYAVWRLFHAYSHLNREWRNKAMEHKNLYDELVNQYKYQTFEDMGEFSQVYDSYGDY
jgi:hypothetical protein